MIIHQTSSPEAVNEFKKELITYFQNQATGKRAQAAIAVRKSEADKLNAKAETYDFMALMLQRLAVTGNGNTLESQIEALEEKLDMAGEMLRGEDN